MQLKLTYDPAIDAWELTHKDVRVETPADAIEWRRLMGNETLKLSGKPVYLLVDVRDFQVAAVMMEEYGRAVRSWASQFLGVVRFGADERTRNAVLLQSLVNGFQANLHPDRASAVQALESLRAKRNGPGRAG